MKVYLFAISVNTLNISIAIAKLFVQGQKSRKMSNRDVDIFTAQKGHLRRGGQICRS